MTGSPSWRTTTAPTAGFGQVLPRPRRPSARASDMKRWSRRALGPGIIRGVRLQADQTSARRSWQKEHLRVNPFDEGVAAPGFRLHIGFQAEASTRLFDKI